MLDQKNKLGMEMNLEKLKEIVGKSRVAMLGTNTHSGIHFRPMAHVLVDDDGKIWFFTSSTSTKVDELENDSQVILTYSNESENNYFTLKGNAQLSADKEKMKELFSPYTKAWFPEGLEDPTICLLVVQPYEAEYWSANESKIITSIKMLWAAVTNGKPPAGEHAKVRL